MLTHQKVRGSGIKSHGTSFIQCWLEEMENSARVSHPGNYRSHSQTVSRALFVCLHFGSEGPEVTGNLSSRIRTGTTLELLRTNPGEINVFVMKG